MTAKLFVPEIFATGDVGIPNVRYGRNIADSDELILFQHGENMNDLASISGEGELLIGGEEYIAVVLDSGDQVTTATNLVNNSDYDGSLLCGTPTGATGQALTLHYMDTLYASALIDGFSWDLTAYTRWANSLERVIEYLIDLDRRFEDKYYILRDITLAQANAISDANKVTYLNKFDAIVPDRTDYLANTAGWATLIGTL